MDKRTISAQRELQASHLFHARSALVCCSIDIMLVPIRSDISFDDVRFQDTFCWSPSESPSAAHEFAKVLCHENGLPQTAVAAVVTAIQHQVQACTAECPTQRSLPERLETIK